MEDLRDMYKKDMRFIQRELRNSRMSNQEYEAMLSELPDVSENARWMRPDGGICSQEEQEILFKEHEEIRSLLDFGKR
jgi:hypothetical protein